VSGPGVGLGAVADDVTGATDLAGALVARGVRTALVLGVPDGPLRADADAVVVALTTRTAPADRARDESCRSARWLRSQGAAVLYAKYCSTFDSTPAGNIGPVADALLDLVGAPAVVHCPAYPATGRTLYQGHLFVGRALLSETGMRHHPLTPMTDPDLVRVLGAQTDRPVGLLALAGDGGRARRLADLVADGAVHVLADAVTDADVDDLAAAAAGHPLLAGGAAFGAAAGAALTGPRAGPAAALDVPGGTAAVLVGSASEATRGQVASFARTGPVRRFTAEEAADPATVDALLAWAELRLDDGPVLLAVDADPAAVGRAQRVLGGAEAARGVERVLGELARRLHGLGVRRLVVAGGESSGAVAGALGITQVRVGPPICPGVPWTVSDDPELAVAFKSGNFGGPTFFTDAFAVLRG
jgi:uncharacterized protein YgbK (DUF1537 family)